MIKLSTFVVPHARVSRSAMLWLVGLQVGFTLLAWVIFPGPFVPSPAAVLRSLHHLWRDEGLLFELWASFKLDLYALTLSAVMALGLAWLSTIAFFRPAVAAFSKLRFLSLVGLNFYIAQATGGGEAEKVWTLVFAMGVFFLTAFAAVVSEVPQAALDHARTLRLSEWRTVYEVVILGTRDKAIEALRQNAAIGWAMLTMVEGMVRTNGGIGVLLLNHNKYMEFDALIALQLVVLVVGLLQDNAIGLLRDWLCPYAVLQTARRTS
jgi:NitT/TauT family transport system permease protein